MNFLTFVCISAVVGCFRNANGQQCQCQSVETCMCNAQAQRTTLQTTCMNNPTCLQSLTAGNANSQAVQACLNQAMSTKTSLMQQSRQCLYTSGNICTGTAAPCSQTAGGIVAPPLPPGVFNPPISGRKKRHLHGGFGSDLFGRFSQPFANYQLCVSNCVRNNGITTTTVTGGRHKRGRGGFGGGRGSFGGRGNSGLSTCLSQSGITNKRYKGVNVAKKNFFKCDQTILIKPLVKTFPDGYANYSPESYFRCNTISSFGSFATAQQTCNTQSATLYQNAFLQKCNCLVGALGLTPTQVNCTAYSQVGFGFGGRGGIGGFGNFGRIGGGRFGGRRGGRSG